MSLKGIVMFGSLKKRLKEALQKVTGRDEEKQESLEEKVDKLDEKIEEEKIEYEIKEEENKSKERLDNELEQEMKEFERIPEDVYKSEEEEEKILREEIKQEFEEEIKKGDTELEPSVAEKETELKTKIGLRERFGLKAREPKPIIEEPAVVEKKPEPEIKTEPEAEQGFLRGLIKKVAEEKLSEDSIGRFLEELKLALLENDTALEAADRICGEVKNGLIGKSVKRGSAEKVIKESLRTAMLDVMQQEKMDLDNIIKGNEVTAIIFLGFNGVGKTTTIAKLAHKFREYKPVIAAGGTFRAASIEQLEEHAKRLGIKVIKHNYGDDSAAVIFDAVKHAKASGSRLVLADTAGRSHSNINLMDELKKVCRVNPGMKVLVIDSLTGNDIYEQSRLFNDAVNVDAIILTKTDVYERGGAALSAAYTIKKPIIYLGTGQGDDDLKEFNAEEIADNLL